MVNMELVTGEKSKGKVVKVETKPVDSLSKGAINPTRLFISGLAPGVTQEALKNMFPKVGLFDHIHSFTPCWNGTCLTYSFPSLQVKDRTTIWYQCRLKTCSPFSGLQRHHTSV